MEFRTQIPFKKQEKNLIDYNSKVMLLGSCFSDNIGAKFEYYKFQNTINSFGILFHPIAIENFIDRAIKKQFYSKDDLVFHNERYHCFDAHSSLSNTNKVELLNNLNGILESTNQQISECTHLIITLGTAWVYEYIESNQVVANCHKIPQKQFKKRILSIQEIEKSIKNVEQLVRSINNDIQLIYTVSPVRHTKDGYVENQQSKSHLLSAIHQFLNQKVLIKNFQSKYFPSYEIMMDELRDYRFYTEDMIHPNQTAIDYIWEKFQNVWFQDAISGIMKKVAIIQSSLAHRPFNPESDEHQQFLKQLEFKKENLTNDFPFMRF